MKKSLKIFSFCAFCAVISAGCAAIEEPKVADSYQVTPESISSTANGGEFDLTVAANLAWTVSAGAEWISVSPESGEGDAEVKVTLSGNVADPGTCAPARNGVITFMFGDNEVKVTVSQDAEVAVFVVIGETADITYEQTRIVAQVEHNISYDVEMPADATWLTQPAATKAVVTDELVFIAARNRGEARSAVIKFKAADNTEKTVTVNQGKYAGIAPDGASEGLFSVSATKQVFFALGNVQATIALDEFRFASNQWDALGVDAAWTDLFSYDNVLQAATVVNGWTVLTKDEWNYLLTGRDGAAEKCKLATVNDGNADHYGLVIMPDVYAGTIADTYTLAEWSANEVDNNAIFLPASGYSYGISIAGVGEGGSYWSLSDNGEANAYGIDFDAVSIYPMSNSLRIIGQAVRPVFEYEAK